MCGKDEDCGCLPWGEDGPAIVGRGEAKFWGSESDMVTEEEEKGWLGVMRATSLGVLPRIQALGSARYVYYPMDPHIAAALVIVPTIKGTQVARGKAGTRSVPLSKACAFTPLLSCLLPALL